MRTIRQKFTSFILMFAMLLLGLCYGNTQADSSLMYGIIHHTDSVYENSDFSEISQQLSSETSERMVSANAYLCQEIGSVIFIAIILFDMSFCFITMQIYDVLIFLICKLCLNV